MTDPWMSILLGGGIGVAYGVAAYGTLGLAAYRLQRHFMLVFFGGMVVRMLGLLVAVGLLGFFVQPQFLPFASALTITLLGVVAVEIWAALRHVQRGSRNEQPS